MPLFIKKNHSEKKNRDDRRRKTQVAMPIEREQVTIAAFETEAASARGAADPAAKDAACPSFADLGLSEEVLLAVSDMGYTTPTPVQAAAIPEALDGRDVLAAAQTGTGKTAAFLLPTMNNLPHVPRSRGRGKDAAQGPLMLVVTPTRELAQQIEEVCHAICLRTGHKSVTVVGGVSYNPQRDKLKRGCDILIATPGRLQDLINQGACSLDQVQILVLDEADRMLDMGFLPDVRRIVGYTREDRQTLLFSATLDEKQVGSITDLVHDPVRVEIAPVTSTADTVKQYVLPVSAEAKNGLLAQVLKREGASRVIVFTRTKHRADACSRRLARAGFTTAAIHGDRTQAQRERALKAFREGSCEVLVATDVLARGIDITDVSYVVNFDVPEDPVDYIHRIGRTGRAGEEGWSLTFVTPDDVAEFFDIEALMGKTVELFDPEGLDLGAHPAEVDPNRVPAKAPAGKKEKQRRRKAAKRAADPGAGRSGRSRKDRAKTENGQVDGASAGAKGSSAKVEEAASKPSRRKRPGKTRVRAAEESENVELLTEHEARTERRGRECSERAGRGKRNNRTTRSERGDRGGNRPKRRSAQERNDETPVARESGKREAWRNYDEPVEHTRRGGRGATRRDGQMNAGARGGRAGGRDNRGGYASRAAMGSSPAPRRSTRRPGDHGGRR